MQQVLHLHIVDRDRGAALAAWYGKRWLLPVLICGERARAALVVATWAAEHGVPCDLAGQWLGRVGPDATDWLMVMRAAPFSRAADPKLEWSPLADLTSTASLDNYQGWAVAACLEHGSLPSVPGPFGNLTWLDDVKAWISAAAGTVARAVTPYRVSAHEVVLGAETRCGPVYFKGLRAERACEARLTRAMAALAPASFARTLAVEERADGSVWWLAAGCPGQPGDDGNLAAGALARLQRRVIGSGPVLRELRRLDLDAVTTWASGFIDDAASGGAIQRCVERAANASVPESWIPMDLDPTNVLVDGGEVRFIDLDDSYLGPAPLAMAVFSRRCRDASLYRTYEHSWFPPLSGIDWSAFEVTAAVVDAWLGWQRVERHTCRGEVHGALDLAATRTRERLSRCVHRR